MGKVTVLIAEELKILREGLQSLLASEPDIEVKAETGDGEHAVKKALKIKPDIVLMSTGIRVLNGFSATRRIKKFLPICKVIILSKHQDDEKVLEAFKAGASGFITSSSAFCDLMIAIRSVNDNHYYVYPSACKKLIEVYIGNKNQTNFSFSYKSRSRR